MLGKPYRVEQLRRVVERVLSPPPGRAAGGSPGG